jgi:hypothetical protein
MALIPGKWFGVFDLVIRQLTPHPDMERGINSLFGQLSALTLRF